MPDRYSVKVKTNSGIDEIVEFDEKKGSLIVKLKAQPRDGKANLALIKFLSSHFKKKVRIVSGKTSRKKVVELFE